MLSTLAWGDAREEDPRNGWSLHAKRQMPCKECKQHTAVLCGLAHNIASSMPRLIDTIHQMGDMFQDYRVVIYESGSDDGTAGMLAAWHLAFPGRVTVISERKDHGGVREKADRTVLLASMRNRLADVVFGLGSVLNDKASPAGRRLAGQQWTLRSALRQLSSSLTPFQGRFLHSASLDEAASAEVTRQMRAEAMLGSGSGLERPAATVLGARRLQGFKFDVVVVSDLDFEFGIDVGGVASVFRPHSVDVLEGWFGYEGDALLDGPGGNASMTRAIAMHLLGDGLPELTGNAPGVPLGLNASKVPPRPRRLQSAGRVARAQETGRSRLGGSGGEPQMTDGWPHDWDAATAYGQQSGSGFYWDWAALRLRGLKLENHIDARHEEAWYPELRRRLTLVAGMPWLPVRCAFGGLAVYRAAALQAGRWRGDVSSNGCEHIGLCQSMAAAGFRAQFIVPSMVQLYDQEHGAGSWAKRFALANPASSSPTNSGRDSAGIVMQVRDALWLRAAPAAALKHPGRKSD